MSRESSGPQFIELGGLRAAIHRWGEPGGRAALCLGSTGLSGLQWRRLGKMLSARGYQVLAPDLIAYGQTDDWPGPGPFTTARDVDLAEAVLALVEGPVDLVGHSYGGRVGLAVGLRRPERLRSLSLFEPTCFGVLRASEDPKDAAAVRELENYDADGRFLAEDFGGSEAWLERFVDYWSGAGAWAELGEDERGRWLRARRKMFEEVRETTLDEIPGSRYAEALGHLPLLAMSGAESTLAGRRCAQALARCWQEAAAARVEQVEFAELGHMAPVLAAREVAARVAGFVTAIDDAGEGGTA
ncbi:alpha/beta hydrolase [Pseudenhygromyxa sp. WMMC2535]|uniref:alpha/beta fold hydrolase n=1 Tax=Pseudenhygromyxa sp. WMMC2535 TaxID=2712867 RepID=UPI0015553749|nr:alpha/beta hydrolase [Pseudenhygromyxa sp. WMMC2535]NVB40512.1 alpha/beta hydrolase [Pseudenhygromyxa sp. WMMC2535]